MIRSMTGFGKAECTLRDKKVYVEVKALNSKQADTNTRLPLLYREKELEIRQLLVNRLHRGKIDCTMHYELIEGAAGHINEPVVKDYFGQLQRVAGELEIPSGESLLSAILKLPDAIISEKGELEAPEWKKVKETLEKALEETDAFRSSEGKSLEVDLTGRVKSIREKLSQVAPFEEERVEHVKERIRSGLNEYRGEVDENRFEQELIYYLEKLDISEEKVRLANHCSFFMDTLKLEGPVGKKLGFISQEMGREINTLGSKANHTEIQRLVVEMKDELERIKEQVLNVL